MFDIGILRRILENVAEYDEGHHMGRPFMSAYQIAIKYAQEDRGHRLLEVLDIGGEGIQEHKSLTQQIAKFLSQYIKAASEKSEPCDIQGGFLSHEDIHVLSFNGPNSPIKASTLKSKNGHSIFRYAPLSTLD